MSHVLHDVTTIRSMGDDIALLSHTPPRHDRSRSWTMMVERGFDVTVAAFFIVALLPLIGLLALAVYVSDPGPVFFAHKRIGRDGRVFACLKFRTMVHDAEARLADLLGRDMNALAEWTRDHKLRNDPRVTTIGNFLRRSSLDEIPQLFNVLRGTMSLVGPRPIVFSECDRYGHYFANYCTVRPGITGLWQISGRNDVSYRRRVAYDVLYARRKSLILDFKILALTLPCVAMQRGAY